MVPRNSRKQQPPNNNYHHHHHAFCPLLAKGNNNNNGDDDDEGDPLESEGWEPNDDEGSDDALDLDDVESSVTGTNDDEIDYDDDGEVTIEEEGVGTDEEEDEDSDIDEEDSNNDDNDDEDDDDDETDEDYDIEDSDDIDALLLSGGMTEKREEGYSKWWEDYGFDSREDFDNHELFPGGMAGLADNYEAPDNDFWDDDITMVPLQEDPSDPDFNANLKAIQETSAKRKAASVVSASEASAKAPRVTWDGDDDTTVVPENEFDTMDELSELLDTAIPGGDDDDGEELTLEASDGLEDIDAVRAEMLATTNLIDDEPYVGNNRTNIAGTGITDEEMEALDRSWKKINKSATKEHWNKVSATQFDFDYSAYPVQYHYDMQETAVEIGSASYNIYPWLKYDMGFNVSNLILASVKHNPDAPVILQHWYPQLMVCERYQHARDRDFDFTWEDVNGASLQELERYYLGFGYDEIPKKATSETGMISFEDADEQELKMAAMEKWMIDVYNSEWDRKDFDDEDIKGEDNVFSDNFKMPQHPDLPSWEDAQEDIAGWKEEWDDEDDLQEGESTEGIDYRDRMGQSIDFEKNQDADFQKNFRGHLVVACGNFEDDLDVAESITTRMEKEFGNAIYTETKIYQHATEADNVFEVWLESYEIDLLHSKRRAFTGVDGWDDTKLDVDAEQLDYLVKEVGQLTNDDARNSYRWSEELGQ